jgi:5-methyltetrahydrofolate--homocysteine methyltransferase
VRTIEDQPLDQLVERIDWTPFFATWELNGLYPAILSDQRIGEAARSLQADSLELLDRIVSERLLLAKGVVGFWPANSVGDDIELFTDETRRGSIGTIHTLRQQMVKPPGRPNMALADFTAPRDTGLVDYVGAFAVTAGHRLDALVAEFESAHDDYSAIMARALADRLAEAFAERLHEVVRRELWGYASEEGLSNEDLIAERYQGIRPAPGYPACPDHTEKGALFDLLGAEERAGIKLTESFAMLPAAAVSGYYFWHPDSAYFGLGRIGRDQLVDYAKRKGMPIEVMARWLAPNLAED